MATTTVGYIQTTPGIVMSPLSYAFLYRVTALIRSCTIPEVVLMSRTPMCSSVKV
ncbi:hypothetical protein L218DRAFT_954017 [Marasmius fiardii PR-910]|nr:hypothetical protein L218DRAFT_954017 [Marasmius fiardii PR-910]